MMGRLVWRGQRQDDTSRTHGQVRAAEEQQWRMEARYGDDLG